MSEQTPQGNVLRYTTVGVEFIVTFGLFLTAGLIADLKLDTAPGFTVLGAACGFAAGLYHLLKKVRRLRQSEEQEHPEP